MDKSKTRKMIIGQKLRELREKKGLLLRQVAAELEVDTAYMSKMERGEKNIKREFIIKLAEIYRTDKDQLLTIWLADMVYDILKEEDLAKQALDLAGKHIELIKKRK
ncbi:MAG: helix-turn-helix transcriptional regulator [Bacteroidota bacterium]